MKPWLRLSLLFSVILKVSGEDLIDQRIFLHEAFRFSTEIDALHILVPITFEAPNAEFKIWAELLRGLAQSIKDQIENATDQDEIIEASERYRRLAQVSMPLLEISNFVFSPNFLDQYVRTPRDPMISELDFLMSKLHGEMLWRGEYLGFYNHFNLDKLRIQLGEADTNLPLIFIDGPDAFKIEKFSRLMVDYMEAVSDYVSGAWQGYNFYKPRFNIELDATEFQLFYLFLNSYNLLPDLLFNGDFMTKFKAKLNSEAMQRGYELFMTIPDDPFRTQVSHVITEDRQLLLLIHWPVLNSAKTFGVYRATPVPSALPRNHPLFSDKVNFVAPVLQNEVVVISSETRERQVFQENLNLESCGRSTQRSYLCLNFFSTNQPLNHSCYETLMKEDHNALMANCKIGSMPSRDWHMVIGDGESLVFTTAGKSEMVCNLKTVSNLILPNVTQLVRLPVGCGLELQSESLWSGFFHRQLDCLEVLVKLNLEPFTPITWTWIFIRSWTAFWQGFLDGLWQLPSIIGYSILFTTGTWAFLCACFGFDIVFHYLARWIPEIAQLRAQMYAQAALAAFRRRCYG